MEGVREGLGSVDAAVIPCGHSQMVFGRDEERSNLQLCR